MTIEKKTPSAILTADIHLRDDIPICRTDDYWRSMWQKVKFISKLQKQYQVPVLDAGDLFHKWKSSPYLLATAIRKLPEKFITIPGNHDMPQHNLSLLNKSGLNVLRASNTITCLSDLEYWRNDDFIVYGMEWSNTLPINEFAKACLQIEKHKNLTKVLLLHTLVYNEKAFYFGTEEKQGESALKLLKKLPMFDLIVTGHNHQSFTVEYEERLLVNPGSLLRMSADQIDHRPRVYLWYARTNTIAEMFPDIEKEVVSREHIIRSQERDERIETFVAQLKKDVEIGFSFEKNLETFLRKNKVSQKIQNIIQEVIADDNK